jgi:transposase-like protein
VVGSHEVRPQTRRRTFTWEQKKRIIDEASQCDRGALGALLRREGIYSSQLARWRRALNEKAAQPHRGRPANSDEKDRKIERLEREVARLEREAVRTAALLDIQKKAFSLLEAVEAAGAR